MKIFKNIALPLTSILTLLGTGFCMDYADEIIEEYNELVEDNGHKELLDEALEKAIMETGNETIKVEHKKLAAEQLKDVVKTSNETQMARDEAKKTGFRDTAVKAEESFDERRLKSGLLKCYQALIRYINKNYF
jgi:hypothetical protein